VLIVGNRRTASDRIIRLVVSCLTTLSGGWLFMLAVGVIHGEWISACPTIGFWWAVLLGSLIRGALYNPALDSDKGR
jgi:hypothetical protein